MASASCAIPSSNAAAELDAGRRSERACRSIRKTGASLSALAVGHAPRPAWLLGVDRLLMLLSDAEHIREVLPFAAMSSSRAAVAAASHPQQLEESSTTRLRRGSRLARLAVKRILMKRSALVVLPLLAALVWSSGCNRPRPAVETVAPTSLESQIVVAVIGKVRSSPGDVDKLAARELYEAREKALENLITDRVIGAAAGKERQKTSCARPSRAKVPTVSEAKRAGLLRGQQAAAWSVWREAVRERKCATS